MPHRAGQAINAPEPPKREEELSECIDQWVERVRRLEAHVIKYALPALYKVTALRLMMVGKAKEHFEIWEAEHESDDDGGFNEILNKIRAINETDGIAAYFSLYKWFTEISGLGLTEQARRLMHPEPPKREEELSECIDQWVERVR